MKEKIIAAALLLISSRAFCAEATVQSSWFPPGAQDREIVIPPGEYAVTSPIVLKDMRNVSIRGEGVTLKAVGPTSAFFGIVGADGLHITGFRLIGHASASVASTGSNPAIMVGTVDAAETRANRNVEIDHFTISGANWAAIMVYGRRGPPAVIKNEGISIHDNILSDSSTGIFVYKNARNVLIQRNQIRQAGQDGIAVDTRAASDAVDSEANSGICITDNHISQTGLSGQGIGILIKGDNQSIVIARNEVSDISAQRNAMGQMSAGIAVVPDFGHRYPRAVRIADNRIDNVGLGHKASFGMYIAPNTHAILFGSNSIGRTGGPSRSFTPVAGEEGGNLTLKGCD